MQSRHTSDKGTTNPLQTKVEYLEAERVDFTDKIASLNAESAAYRAEIETLNKRVKQLEAEALEQRYVVKIGMEVRLRFLEKHRQRMGKPLGHVGHERVKMGDRAAHRGRPLVDSWICLSGLVKDKEVYEDLYGIPAERMEKWIKVPELVEVAGFRASLRCEDNLFQEFEDVFCQLLDLESQYDDADALAGAFERNRAFSRYILKLQDLYDQFVETSAALRKAQRVGR